MKRPTQHDIAIAASVSVSTLSRYLHKRSCVSEDKQQRIQQAMIALNYRPQPQGHRAHPQSSYLIGVISPNILCTHSNAILSGLINTLADYNLTPLISIGKWNNAIEMAQFQLLLKQGVDGVIMIGGSLTAKQLQGLSHDIPTIIVGNLTSSVEPRYNIDTNCFVGGYMATNHLLRLGHTHIAHITGLHFHPDARQRLFGYQEAIMKAGLPHRPELILPGNFEVNSGARAVQKLLSQQSKFTAIFAANDHMAFGAIRALKKAGYRVPEQISVIGFDDHELAATFTPPLTTVNYPSRFYGVSAAQRMAELLGLTATHEINLGSDSKIDVVVRSSTRARYRQ